MQEKNEILTFNKKKLFIEAATAYVNSCAQEFRMNDFLYEYGIDIANHASPASHYLEKFISDIYDDEYGNIIDCLLALAEFGVTDVGDHDVTTVEEIYDSFFKEA
jgi:hypothetical protein